MSRQVPTDRPLSDEDRAYLESRGLSSAETLIRQIDEAFPAEAKDADEEPEAEKSFDDMTAEELKAALEKRELSTGVKNKAEAIERLKAFEADSNK